MINLDLVIVTCNRDEPTQEEILATGNDHVDESGMAQGCTTVLPFSLVAGNPAKIIKVLSTKTDSVE